MFEVSGRVYYPHFYLRVLHIFCRKLSVFAFVLVSASFSSYAGQASLSHYFQESWTTRDGLPHNTINNITQSKDGYLWLSTWEGAVRFNGREFDVFGRGPLTGLPDSGIRGLNTDSDGNVLFAGSRGGVSKRTDAGWQSWPAFNVLLNAVVEQQNGTLWLASEGQGLFRQQADGRRTQYTQQQGLLHDVVHSLLLDSEQRLWVGTGRGLIWLDTRSDTPQINVVSGLPAAPVFAIKQYGDSVLVGTEHGLYVSRQGQAQVFSAALATLPVSSLLVQDSTIWIGSTDRGLMRYSELGLETLSMSGGLPNNRILALFLDREKSIWVGTNGGLFRLRDAPFVTYTAENGVAGDYVRAVLAHTDGTLWIGTSQGLTIQDETGFTAVDLSSASGGQSVLSLVEAQDSAIWIGTYSDGLLRYANGQVTDKYDRSNGLLANEIRAVLPEANGDLWIGTGQGLNFVGVNEVRSYTKKDGLPTPFVIALYKHSDGRLFIGTGGGVAVMQPTGGIETLDFSGLDGAEYAFGFTEDKAAGLIWMTTDRGLVAYNPDSGQLQIIGRSAGLPFDKLFHAVLDRERNIWLSSNRGIIRLLRPQVEQFLSGERTSIEYELFGESDGMQSAQANGGSMQAATMAADGSIVFATSKGVSVVQPADLKRFAGQAPPVVVEGLKVDGSPVNLQQNLQLAAGTHRLELQFAGLGFIMPQRIQYSTKLYGFDQSWIARGTNHTAEYTNLSPGPYTFAVKAAYPQGGWSEHEARFSFVILPYFWQRADFWTIAVLASLLLLGLVLRWRLKALHRREQRLMWQVAEKTVELQQQADHLRAVDRERSELMIKIKQQAQEFEQQARLDALTGLANRRAFDEALTRECARSARNEQSLCLVLLDIDHFKQVNDRFSHSVGDEILKIVARVICRLCRTNDTVARWGGEEFAILLPDTRLAEAAEISERIRLAVMKIDCSEFSANLHITASMGICEYSTEIQHDKLLSRADAALYSAKQQGRNRVAIAE